MNATITTLAVALLASLSLLAGGCQTGAANRADAPDALNYSAEPIDSSVAVLHVNGMSCPLCANNIDRQIAAVPGVRDVLVDMGTGTVRVTLADEGRPSRAALARAVDQSGFTLVKIETH